jgi:hypothetical protein
MNIKKTQKAYQNNLIMVTNQFGYELFIAPLKDGNIDITDKKEDAETWCELDQTKLEYYRAVTGYTKLEFVKL